MTMFAYDEGVHLRWAKNAPFELAEDTFMAMLEDALVEGVSKRTFADAVRTVSRTKQPFYGFCVLMIGGVARRFEVTLNPHINERIIGVANNAEQQSLDDKAIRSLSLELAHRTKNLMAVISSLASQTARRVETFAEFKRLFCGQIGALSHAHDAIAHTGWDGAVLEQIVKSQLGCDRPDAALTLTGNALGVMLSPNAAQNIAMVLNDLAAACEKDARINLDVEIIDDDGLQMSWKTAQPVGDERLWREFLTKVAPMTLDGTGELFEDDGSFTYVLTVSDDHFARV